MASTNNARWIAGLMRKKDSYPAPFNGLPDEYPEVKGSITVASDGTPEVDDTASSKLSINLVKLMEALSSSDAKEHPYIGIDGDDILVEMPSLAGGGQTKLCRFNTKGTASILACNYAGETYSDDAVVPGVNGTGTQIFVAVLVGLLKLTDGESVSLPYQKMHEMLVSDLKFLMETWVHGARSNLDENMLEALGVVSSIVYNAMTGALSSINVIYKAMGGKEPVIGRLSQERVESGASISLYSLNEANAFGLDSNFLKNVRPDATYFSDAMGSTADYVGADGKYDLTALKRELKLPFHELTDEEQTMVPELDEHYVIPAQLVEAARTIKDDWRFPGLGLAPNYLLEGDSGSGKTMATLFWACVFGIPRTKMTMNPAMDTSTLIGAFYPVFKDMGDWELSDKERVAVNMIFESMRSKSGKEGKEDIINEIRRAFDDTNTRDDLRGALGIPADFDVDLDAQAAWEALGQEGAAPDAEDIKALANQCFTDASYKLLAYLTEQAEKDNVSYRFVLSELMRAFQNGWLVEIQEAASVLRPGVLTELNSLLEEGGSIELPNGKRIYRHPDTIVVFTTNRGYAGNADINESLRDRCLFGLKMNLPTQVEMAQRAMARTGMEDSALALKAAKVIEEVSKEAKAKNIHGSFGMRSLIAWMMDLKRMKNPERSFKTRVIFKMTTDEDDVALLMDAYHTVM